MLARTTRLEFLILAIGLLVLVFCSQPPQYGSADVAFQQDVLPTDSERTLSETPAASEQSERESIETEPSVADNPLPPRLGTVDARNLRPSAYNDLMYGNVTVRWVWDGQKFVPQKVCVVEEKDGVSSVWSFDQQGRAVVSEIPADPSSGR